MTTRVVIDLLVALGVAATVISCVGLLAMRSAIDRLHYASAGTALGPALLAAAVCVREGVVSAQGLASMLIAVVLAFAGSALGVGLAKTIRLETAGAAESTAAERDRGGAT
ncbi:MAG: monovalent cation/H(+) antiporter subunit G [Gaiellaceae bacterium]